MFSPVKITGYTVTNHGGSVDGKNKLQNPTVLVLM